MKKFTIWQNYDTDYEGMREDYQDIYELTDEEMEEISDSDISAWVSVSNDMCLDDERANLNITIPNGILVIADLGFWYGRRCGYKEIATGNIADCLYDNDCVYCDWYCDMYDMRFKGSHHDGTHYYIYRTWADGISEQQRENYLDKLYRGEATHKDMLKYTRSIRPYIADVYGWNGKKIKAERSK